LADTSGLGPSFTTTGLTAGQVLRASGASAAAFASLQLSDLPAIPTVTVLGNATAGTAAPTALSETQLTALINTFSATLSGAVPASGGGTTKFLRADGNFSVVVASANPSAIVGLSAVNGTAATFMTSDSAPALNQGIAPTWTGAHTYSPGTAGAVGLTVNSNAGVAAVFNAPSGSMVIDMTLNTTLWGIEGISGATNGIINGDIVGDLCFRSQGGNILFSTNSGSSAALKIASTGAVTIPGKVGFNGAAAATQPTGYGTPTGGSHQASFAASTITLPNLAAAVAQLIIDLKSYGLIGT
jgi:hypothetical protein